MKIEKYYCDRCGEDCFNRPYGNGVMTLSLFGKDYDLCDTCAYDIKKSVENFDKTRIDPTDIHKMSKHELAQAICTYLDMQMSPNWLSNGSTVTIDFFRAVVCKLAAMSLK
jgi:hypothetical protein